MPKLLPIRAICYAGGGDLSTKIAPPYDVLDEGPKRELLARDPHNIVAIDLPVTPPKTVGPDVAYEAAGALFRQWLTQGILVRDPRPAVFAYEQAFVHGKLGPLNRRGLFAALGVETFNRPHGGIFRHEHTIRGGTDDRLKLMRATAAQLSPVFGVYDDPAGEIRRLFQEHFTRSPDVTSNDDDGVEHRLWRIEDSATIDNLRGAFAATDVFIADGHHRYTTALNYHREHPGNLAAASCLFALVAAQDEGLRVHATHRVLWGMRGYTFDALRRLVEGDDRFTLTPVPGSWITAAQDLIDRMRTIDRFAVGLYESGQAAYIFSANDDDPLRSVFPDQPAVWRKLDVAILHELVIDRILRPHFGAELTYGYYGYLNDFIAACGLPDRLGVIMRPTPLQSVIDAARAGAVMPPKSTFFYPKLATGLVINPLE